MTETSPGLESSPLWWQEHAWNDLTMGFLLIQRRTLGIVALQTSLVVSTEGGSAIAPPLDALPSLLEFLRAKPVDSTETFFETWRRLHDNEKQPENRENNSLGRAYLLNIAPWTVEEADQILDAFNSESPTEDLFIGNRPFPDERIIASVYALNPMHNLAMQGFLTNPHLPLLRSSTGENWYTTEVIKPLLDEVGKCLISSDRENFAEYLRAVVDNPCTSIEHVETISAVTNIEMQADQYSDEKDSFFERLEIALSGINRKFMFEHRLAEGQKLTDARARLLARSTDWRQQAPKLFQILMADPNSEALGREIVRDIFLDRTRWHLFQHALPMLGAVLHSIYEEHEFSPQEVPLEWALEVLL